MTADCIHSARLRMAFVIGLCLVSLSLRADFTNFAAIKTFLDDDKGASSRATLIEGSDGRQRMQDA